MSRGATAEYVGAKRRAYAAASKSKRRLMLAEVCETTGFTKDYAIRLLSGSRKYRERKGRGKKFGEEAAKWLTAVWMEAGCMCTTYFKTVIAEWAKDYSERVAHIPPDIARLLTEMSASTMDRLLRGVKRVKLGSVQRNRRSGVNNSLKSAIECKSGEEVIACRVGPGDIQVDTFALCGGSMADSFYWILTATDRKTQWTRISPAWNRGEAATLEALGRIAKEIPFVVWSMHSDNGGETINRHLVRNLPGLFPSARLSRSRPYHSNDNAHVEEKNRHVGRELFGERRIDSRELEGDLMRLCDLWSDYRNFFCPCKMLVSKVKKEDGKGFVCRYDSPRTPYQRVMEEPTVSDDEKARLTARRGTMCALELRHRAKRLLRRICRRQDELSAARRRLPPAAGDGSSPASLRSATSSHAPLCGRGRRVPNAENAGQYLTNGKPPLRKFTGRST